MNVIFWILIVCASSVVCLPARPLNERSKELSWQAWLLVDDQNQNRQDPISPGGTHDGTRRKITPKSVFIAPTFKPFELPPCADGYRSDPMGRCIKIIKLDEAAHLEFLLQKLNEKFGETEDYDYEEVEEIPTPGPFQVDIPLDEKDNDNSGDIAIVVAPTNSEMMPSTNPPTTTELPLETTTSQDWTTELTTEEDQTEPTTTTESPSTLSTSTETSEEPTEPITSTLPTTTTIGTTTSTTTRTTTTTTTTPIPLLPATLHFPDDLQPEEQHFIRFPDDPSPKRDTSHQSQDFALPQQDQPVLFETPPPPPPPSGHIYNHRSRDKHNLFLLPSQWNEANLHHNKPLVLRFSRKHAYVDTQQFNHPDYYRSVPPDDLSYIFGMKRRRPSHR